MPLSVDVLALGRFCSGGPRSYAVSTPAIGLHLGGIAEYRTDGVVLCNPGPFLVLLPPGTSVTMTATAARDSWGMDFSGDMFRPSRVAGMVDLLGCGGAVRVPMVTRLGAADAELWRQEFQRMYACFLAPIPQNRLRLDLGVAALLRHVLDAAHGARAESPASRLKRHIEDNLARTDTLAQVSRQCGYSRNHLRLLFQAEYGVPPQVYRQRARLSRAVVLLRESDRPIKQVAALTGYRQLSHFSAVFRSAFGITPREARQAASR